MGAIGQRKWARSRAAGRSTWCDGNARKCAHIKTDDEVNIVCNQNLTWYTTSSIAVNDVDDLIDVVVIGLLSDSKYASNGAMEGVTGTIFRKKNRLREI